MLPAKAIEKRVAEGLERDERWKIIVRKNNWLCPYCGKIGARELQMDEAIESKIAEHFLRGGCERWEYFEAEPLAIDRLRLLAKLIVFKVRVGRWIAEERRFRFFDADGRWMCPYCVKENDVPKPPSALETGVIVPEEEPFVAAVAKHLLECAEFARGEDQLKPLRDLEERKAKQARRSRTERIKDRFRREAAWRLADAEHRWLCPFCATTGEIRLDDPSGEPPQDFLEAVEAHLVLCKSFSALEGRPRPVEQLRDKLANAQKSARLSRVRDKIRKHSVWRARDMDGHWYCPYCASDCGIRYPTARDAEVLDRFVERVADHLAGCSTYKNGSEIKSKAFLSDVLARENASLTARRHFRKKLIEDPVFGITDEVEDWACPYCRKVQKAIHIYPSRETAVFEKTVEQVVQHLQDECDGYTPEQDPRITKAELVRIARPGNSLRASGVMEARVVQRPKASEDDWARLKKDVAEVRQRVEAAKQRELSMKEARSKQLRLLPATPQLPGYEFGCVYKPCDDVGGDFYDFIKVDEGRIGLAIGDIAGHGIEAALLMGLAKKLLEVHGRGRSSAAEALVLANADIFPDLDERTFVTVFYGVLEVRERLLRFSRAGHNPLILFNPARKPSLQIHDSKGMALGMDAGPIFRESIEELELALKPGDLLVQYTDGVTEAMNGKRDEFGIERLSAIIEEHGHNEVEYVLWKIEKAIEQWMGGSPPKDDVTMIAVKVLS
ncbi:MAG: PP2C family protein-serine/threonine phosphatase [Planctomycetota bacterium]